MGRFLGIVGRSILAGLLLSMVVAVPSAGAVSPPAAVPIAKQIGNTVSGFSMAVILSKHEQAHSYMTPVLHARCQGVALDQYLGITTHPYRYFYTITSSTAAQAAVRLRFYFPAGTSPMVKNLTMVKMLGSWRINTIAPSGKNRLAPDVGPSGVALVVVGKTADNLWPLAITIYDDGTVSGFWTTNSKGAKSYARVHLSLDAVGGLMTLMRAEGFFSMPAKVGVGPANSASRFISVRTATGMRTVSGQGTTRNVAFNQLYAVLLAAAGVACSPGRQCGV